MRHLKKFESTNDSGKRIKVTDVIKHYFSDFMFENKMSLDKEIYNPNGYHEYENGDFTFLINNENVDIESTLSDNLEGFDSMNEILGKLEFLKELDVIKQRLEKLEGIIIKFDFDCDFSGKRNINEQTSRIDIVVMGKHLFDY